jgi:hypothetical protein
MSRKGALIYSSVSGNWPKFDGTLGTLGIVDNERQGEMSWPRIHTERRTVMSSAGSRYNRGRDI